MTHYEPGQEIVIKLPQNKSLSEYAIGNTIPLFADAAKTVLGKWRVTEHITSSAGTFVKGVVTGVNNPPPAKK